MRGGPCRTAGAPGSVVRLERTRVRPGAARRRRWIWSRTCCLSVPASAVPMVCWMAPWTAGQVAWSPGRRSAEGSTSMNGASAGVGRHRLTRGLGRRQEAARRLQEGRVVIRLEQEAQELLDGLLVAVLLEAEEVVLDAQGDALLAVVGDEWRDPVVHGRARSSSSSPGRKIGAIGHRGHALREQRPGAVRAVGRPRIGLRAAVVDELLGGSRASRGSPGS